ncbi:hypothetical protein DOTSEDRAFT_69893 [Dothistroma septosporum NZE10]|uniref:T6SS Phospholipase effector Tle1-like catalytic domain-containing protein n=1 Tax=Dothistroma septosporum (strain NZE10 / CBS 128990) TaxID=675120 RepID=N1PX68_DOTSN|nr:hypothetical protein DOTSEDRAFT_69893 [Dothistroma septosporum NZE10]
MEGRHHSAADEQSRHQIRLPKKLIVCCDGTWMDRDNGYKAGKIQSPSNVTRIARAMLAEDDAKHLQIVYYQAGIGTGLGIYDQLLGGGTGLGLSENVRESYAFLASNYSPKDDFSPPDSIFLLGFSRGAYTARSLGGLIAALGILTRKAMPYFCDLFRDWENAGSESYEPQFFKAYAEGSNDTAVLENMPVLKPPHEADENRIDTYMESYFRHLLAFGLTQEANIKATGVWDTVGALGIPVNPFFQRFAHMPAFIREMKWYDTRLSNRTENAFHALALDEHRFPFSPAVWELDPGSTTNLKQVWFPGAHSNCGGSYEDYGMANITLAWMMDQLSGNSRDPSRLFNPADWIQFDDDFIELCFTQNTRYYNRLGTEGEVCKGWAMGKVYNSNTFPQSLAGARTRMPGRYPKTDYETGLYSTTKMLENSCEYIHSSTRARMDLAGREVEPQEWYQKIARYIWRTLTWQPYVRTYRPQRKKLLGGYLTRGGPLEGWKLVDGHASHAEANMEIDMSPGGIKQVHWEYTGTDKTCEPSGIIKEDIFAAGGYEERLLLHDQEGLADQILYSNNRWTWFKKVSRENKIAKTF